MKRLIAAALILSIVLTGCVIGFSFLDKTSKNITDELNIVREYLNEEKTELALGKVESVSEKWDKNKKILKMFIDHNYIVEIDIALSELKSSLSSGSELSESLPILDKIVTRAILLKNSEKLSLENIF